MSLRIKKLIQKMDDICWEVRKSVKEELRTIVSKKDVKILLQALKEKETDWLVKKELFEIISDLGDESEIEEMTDVLLQMYSEAWSHAADFDDDSLVIFVEKIVMKISDKIFEAVVKNLKSDDVLNRTSAVHILNLLGVKRGDYI